MGIMTKKLSVDKVLKIIEFQRRYRFLRIEINKINETRMFCSDILLSMVNNLTTCNNSKIFRGTDSLYIKALDELKEIKKELNGVPEYFTLRDLKKYNISDINMSLVKTNRLIIKYINHIAPENINYILKLLLCDEWIEKFDERDIEKILFLSNMFIPICVWDSDEHKDVIKWETSNKEREKPEMVTKDLLQTLFGSQENKLNSIIIGKKDSRGMPSLIQSISNLLDKKKSTHKKTRVNTFKKIECIAKMDNNKLFIGKNPHALSLIEEKFGACLYFHINKKIIVCQGYFKDDLLNISKNISFVQERYKNLNSKLKYDLLLVPGSFKTKYLNILSLRDILVYTIGEISDEIKKKYNDFKGLQGKPLISSVNEFILASKYRKIDILTLLLLSGPEDKRLAYVLFDVLKAKDTTGLPSEIYSSLHYSIRDLLTEAEIDVDGKEKKLSKISESDIPYERRIALMKSTEEVQNKAMEKLKSIKSSFQGDSKAQTWLDGLLKIPFGVFKECPVINFRGDFAKKLKEVYPAAEFNSEYQIDSFIGDLEEKDANNQYVKEWREYQIDTKEYIRDCRKALDQAVFGHKEAKTQLERIIGQWINGEAKGAVLGLEGPP